MNDSRFSKWQERTHQLRTNTIGLFLSITLATIGFIISQLLDKDFKFLNCYSKIFISIGAFFLLATSFLLILTTLNRLNSFRFTTQIVRKKDNINSAAGIEDLRNKVDRLDNKVISGFNWAIILFLIGEFSVIIGFIVQIANKL